MTDEEIEFALEQYTKTLEGQNLTMVERARLYSEYHERLLQRAKENKEDNGPEQWHNTLKKYAALEARLKALEDKVNFYEKVINQHIRFPH